jgi:hypothetical protein
MAAVIDRMMERYRKEYERNPVFTLFLTILIVFFIIFVVAAVITGGDTFYNVLNSVRSRAFSDYFEMIWSSSDRPYTDWHVIYPPLSVVFYILLGRFIIPYTGAADGGPFSIDEAIDLLRNSQMGIMSFLVITVLIFYALYLIFSKIMKEMDFRKELMFFFLMVLSYPFIYAVERGNNILLALVFCFVFLLGYRSENKIIRYASYIALGCAAGFKLYPAIFALLILRERKYKETVICASIVMLLVFVPLIFTDGTIVILFDNIFTYARSSLGFTNISQITIGLLEGILGMSEGIALIVSYVILGLFTALSFIVILYDKEMKFWKVLALIGCNLILGFGLGVQYQIIYLTPAILYFLVAEKKMTRENLFYIVCFAMTMVLIPGINIAGSISTSDGVFEFYPSAVIGAMESAFAIVIAIALLREGIVRIYRNRLGHDRNTDAVA